MISHKSSTISWRDKHIVLWTLNRQAKIFSRTLLSKFAKIYGFIRVLDGEIKHFVLFDYGLFDKIWDKIKYFITEKGGIADRINHNFAKIRIDSYDSLPSEKILTFCNIVIYIKSVVNKNKNQYYHNIFLEKGSYKD